MTPRPQPSSIEPADYARAGSKPEYAPSAMRRRIHFGLAILLLAGGAVGMNVAKGRGLLQVIKKPLAIRKPLSDMDRSRLEPWKVIHTTRLPSESAEELGTEEYIDWALENPSGTTAWARAAGLFITYYTGRQDQVPHVPEECYQQGTFSVDRDEELEIAAPAGLTGTLPVRRLKFSPPPGVMLRDSSKTYVYYLIAVNGDFYASRNRVRLRMIDDRETHLYYSKVEVSFRAAGAVDEADMDRTAAALLDAAIQELVRSHWPLKGAERGGSAGTEAPRDRTNVRDG